MKTFTVSLLLSALTLTAQAGTSLGICVIHEGRTHLGVMAVAMEATPEVAYLEKKGTVSVEAEGYKCQGEFVVTDSIGPMSLVEVTLINPLLRSRAFRPWRRASTWAPVWEPLGRFAPARLICK